MTGQRGLILGGGWWVCLLAAGLSAAAEPAGLPRAQPADVGMTADVLAGIDRRFEQFVADGQCAGAVTVIVKDGKIVHLKPVGFADLEARIPMKPDTLFGIASMTKPFTACAVMILVAEGKLGLDDPVAKYLPVFQEVTLASGKPRQAITIRHLLTHTSGLVGLHEVTGTLKDSVEAIARRPLAFEPGSKWQYGPGLSVAGRVVEVVSGKPFDVFLAERIFRPLGLGDTTFHPSAEQQKRLARLYRPGKQKPTLEAVHNWLVDSAAKNGPNPSGGLVSQARDLARFYQMILNGGELDGVRILSTKAVAEMTRLQTGELTTGFTPGNGWGLGWCVIRQPQGVSAPLSPGSFGHGGAFGTQAWLDPSRRLICILLVQRTGFGNSDGSDLRATLHELAVQAIR